MIAVVEPGKLRGTVAVPSSKSYAHRLLIAAALSDAPTLVGLSARNADIDATVRCLNALGARIEAVGGGFDVRPIPRPADGSGRPAREPRRGERLREDLPELFCAESGSTLRFLMPVAAALGVACKFTGAGRLPDRPNAVLTDALNAHGARADRDRLPIRLSGRLRGGAYEVAGNISSQYITGLLFALPLCAEDSALRLTTPLASASYVGITLDVLARFGVRAARTAEGWAIPGGQRYAGPGRVQAEGDWSSAAFWRVANRLGSDVVCEGLCAGSAQGDRAIDDQLDRLGGTIDATDTPDLVPALAVAATLHPGTTRIVGAARLRLKESDRLRAVADMLRALGGRAEETDDGLTIHGVERLEGGRVDGRNDHRIVMAAAIAATAARGRVTIADAEAVDKSYPAFFDDFNRLGGRARRGA